MEKLPDSVDVVILGTGVLLNYLLLVNKVVIIERYLQ